ncbi:MAG TPA: hypothetical protein VGK58_13675, partial [Lacipirellulaceae bacterium]
MGAEDWKRVRIADLGPIVTGRTPPGTRPEYFGDGIPFITPTDLNGQRSVATALRRLSDDGAREMA